MLQNRTKITLTAVLALLIGVGGAIPAHADETPIAADTVQELTENFSEIGVDPSKVDGLLAKYAAGQAFDNSSGVAPISVENYRSGITDNVREVFPDGSVTITSLELPTEPTASKGAGEISPMGITGCSYYSSAGVATYSNCKVYQNNGTLTMWYHANYWRSASGSGVSLANTWNWDIQAAGGTCAKDYLGTPTANKARLRAYCTVIGGIGSSYPYLDLNVTTSGATMGANW